MINTVFHSKKPFIGFITGGDGGINYCVDCCLQLISGGVDILEIGFPFSDPVADGPIIQKSSQRALLNNTNASTLLEIASQIRKQTKTPLILFSYYNPLLQKGEAFLKEAKSAGFNGLLVVDLPPAVDTHFYFQHVDDSELYPILLISPSTDDIRLKNITQQAQGFIYYACQKGTTGIKTNMPSDFAYHINRIRKVTQLPIVAGFGIGDRVSAKSAITHANGFVVGSAFVKLMEQKADPSELKKMAESIDPR